MEVLKSGDAPALVSNLEVMQLLQERMAARQQPKENSGVGSANGNNTGEENATKKSPFQHRDWIEETVLNHLQSSPVGGVDVKLQDMPKLVERLRREPGTAAKGDLQNDADGQQPGYGLTNAETLQIINHLPTSPVEVHLLIEDIEKRENLDDEDKQSQFLRYVSEFSGRPVEDGGGDDDEGEDEEDDKVSVMEE
ncbi:hypothetical protein ACHAXR_004572 [Thalassiosira sp. AJA248-18]